MAVRVRVYTWPPTCGMGTLSGRTVGYIFDPLCGMVDLFHRPQMAWPLRVPMPYGGVKQMGAECRGGGLKRHGHSEFPCHLGSVTSTPGIGGLAGK